eukprot:CAMPEP_0201104696 /NCGR_PEP_ID=MMETSP0812-20130820/40604_1 /ASSEMBLY_ACC=CAM_ASM_000668 /TAXON_ID=98059 /ORGANISM="Dinobryon sp., Strain UTEXLB2267" /LENGTH=40 /DNA_ID= /DNA_START= /DNA_END= /DNA_ORIENTATION=
MPEWCLPETPAVCMKVSMDIAGGANSGAEEDNDETIGLRL